MRSCAKSVQSCLFVSALLSLTAALHSTRAEADTAVTLCADADEPGAGMNLRNALRQPVNPATLVNAITFACGGPATVQVRTSLTVTQATRIDGIQNVSLNAAQPLGTAMFALAPGAKFFYLYNLLIGSAATTPTLCAAYYNSVPNCGLTRVLVGHDVVELHNVTINNVSYPLGMNAGNLGIFDSNFSGNTGRLLDAPGPAVVVLNHASFQNNPNAPFHVQGSLSITGNSTFSNSGPVVHGPAAGAPCNLTVERSTFDSNTGLGALRSECNASIGHTTFSGNFNGIPGGALSLSGQKITLRTDQFLNNRAGIGVPGNAPGGAVFWDPPANGTMTVIFSHFMGNATGGNGGAIMVGRSTASPGSQTLNIGASAFSGNSAQKGGGAVSAFNTQVNTSRTIFVENSAASGGAIATSNVEPTLEVFANTLFVRNKGTAGSAFNGDAAQFVNSTLDSNGGTAISVSAPSRAAKHVRLSNTIVSHNAKAGCEPKGAIDDGGTNLQFPGNDCGVAIPSAEPQLDSMYIPLPRSPPMGHGNLTICSQSPVAGTDVYGTARAGGKACSIGAAEGDVQVLGGDWTDVLTSRRGRPADYAQQALLQLLRAAGITDEWLKAHRTK
jgi:predicted outer membrane repeat protein